ncbi:MAG: hypothetical protein PUP92_21925 [Rhizonema sp. PD38]|nr:hypothetical protein [Rhizonema sp. PD38]
MTYSPFTEFFSGSDTIHMHLKIGETPLEALPKDKGKLDILPSQSCVIELHPVFSHISFLLIETLSVTQHGEFFARSKQGKYETIVELGGHMSKRYRLTKEDLREIQQIYEQILDTWIALRHCRKKS